MSELTQSELKNVLRYEPDTGHFYWIKKVATNINIGDIAGTYHNGYMRVRVKQHLHLTHRLAFLYMTGKFPENHVDHINGIRSDCSWINLRDVTQLINNQNVVSARIDNKGDYLGVSFNNRKNKYVAQINTSGTRKHIGYYDTAERASHAYFNAKFLLHEGMVNERFDD